ncbi:hypothetical protein BKA57DRAFT_474211 [Linnemannia elongata]|nr:hypothetical protein BKA57DRAFT_474211 [Linnemannia elongata]
MIRHQILFRALRNEEDPSAGIRPTGPMANLTFKDHVERGGFRIYRPSQFISTTSNLERAIRWVSEDRSALAVIFCRFLHPSIIIRDLSQGHESLSLLHNSFVDIHGEVLVEPHISHPFINPSAVRVLSYSDLVETYQSSFHPSFLQDMAPDWRTFFLNLLHWQFRFRCDFCRRRGHNIKYNHYCREYYEYTSVVFAIQSYNTRIAANRWQ